MAADQTTYAAVLKQLWPQRRINNLAFQFSAFWAMVEKEQDFYEDIKHVALQYGNPQGRSADFATAQTNAGAARLAKFQVTRISDYAVGIVNGETLEVTRHNKGALLSAIENETKSSLEELANTLSFDLWSVGDGVRGVAGTVGASPDLVLSDVNDVVNFEVGMEIVMAATRTGAIRAGSASITDIDPDTGTLTSDADWNAQITLPVATDFLFVQGDAANAGAIKKVSGVPAWIPTTTPTATPFFGLDRTTHTDRLGGVRQVGTGFGTIAETVKALGAKIRYRSGRRARPDTCFMNTLDIDNLDIELGSNRRYTRVDVENADIGFDAIEFATPAGRIRAVEDRYVPVGSIWMTQMNTWKFASVDGAPRIIQHDGNRMLRQTSADGVEFRAVYRGQLYNDAPGWTGYSSLPA
jgi:hypothetical protein